MRLLVLAILLLLAAVPASAADERTTVIVVVGAEGTKEYGEQFHEWAGRWEAAAKKNAG